MNGKKTNFITEVGIFASVGLVLDFLSGLFSPVIWAQGGSISVAMIPIFIMGYRWGLKGGLLTGFVVGTTQVIWSSYLINPVQVLLDYSLPYTLLGFVGISATMFKDSTFLKQTVIIFITVFITGMLRTTSHVISGVYYWDTTFWGSVIYNGGFMLPSVFICIAILVLMLKKSPHLFFSPIEEEML